MSIEEKKKILTLREELHRHNYFYYIKNQPEISDVEYDLKLKELIELEKKYPELYDPTSPSVRVGADPVSEFKKVKHKVPMLSLDNTYSPHELIDFDRRVKKIIKSEKVKYFVELKIDGISVNLSYESGRLVQATTRGNGIIGEDITENVKTIKTVPLILFENVNAEIRGEVFIKKEDFKKINKKLETKFANPRNLAAGTLRQLSSKAVANRPLTMAAYDIAYLNVDEPSIQSDVYEKLKKLGFYIPEVSYLAENIKAVITLCQKLEALKDSFSYEIDGLVIKVNDKKLWPILSSTSKFPRYMIAFKFPPKRVTTKIIDVEFQVGKTGLLTPVARLEPVSLAGTTVSNASLHNFEEILRKNIKIGDTVFIEKAGEIIPQVVASVKSKRTGKEIDIKKPENCPFCNTPVIEENLANIRCPNPLCPMIIKRKIEHFVSRDAMNIAGLGFSIISQMVDKNLISSAGDLYYLKKEQLISLDKIADKSAENLLKAINESRNREFYRLIYAINIKGVGLSGAKLIAKRFKDIYSLMKADKEQLEAIPEIGPKTASAICDFFNNPLNIEMINKLINAGVNIKDESADSVSNSFFTNKNFVLTGTLSKMSRKEAQEKIEKLGGNIQSSVGKKTDYLIVGANPGSKLKKAQKLGVAILTEENFYNYLTEHFNQL